MHRNQNEFTFIEQAIESLVKISGDYVKRDLEQKEKLRHELLRRLILGEYNSADQMSKLLDYTGFPAHTHKFACLLALDEGDRTLEPNALDFIRSSIQKEIWVINNRYVILCIFDASMTDALWIAESETMIKEIKNSQGDFFYYCVSALHEGLDGIHNCYDETLLLSEYLRSIQKNETRIIRYNLLENHRIDTFFDYPIDMELQLMRAMKTGDTGRLNEIFSWIYQRNFVDRRIPVTMVRQLVYTLKGTVIRAMNILGASTARDTGWIVDAMFSEDTLDGILENAILISRHLCAAVQDQRITEIDQTKEKISVFLYQNYMKSTLTLHDLAVSMNISERTMYDLIKDRFNTTFAKMLEGIRIQKACELMRVGSLSIKNVARSVGYANDNTFRSAFKRVMNMTPGEFLLSI
jgi:YesN/AraC family two-component response regulator